VGRELGAFKTTDGEIYNDAVVKEATPLELSIRTSIGPKRLKLEFCPKELQDELQYDPKKADEELARIQQQEATREVAGFTGEGIQRLRASIGAMQSRIQIHKQTIDSAGGKKRINTAAAAEHVKKARYYDKLHRDDLREGRGGSQNGVRAKAEDKRAYERRRANEKLDQEVAEARAEVQKFEREIAEAEKEIMKLMEERRMAAEEAKKAQEDEGTPPVTGNP
jgi:hypothetical protein